jgi:hypothetical protein
MSFAVLQANHTQLECWDKDGKPHLREYTGCGKLDGKVALLTGADSVNLPYLLFLPLCPSLPPFLIIYVLVPSITRVLLARPLS